MTTPIEDLMDDVAEALSECVMMSRDLGLDGDRFIGWTEVYRLEETASRAICSAQHAFSVFADSSRLRKEIGFHRRLLPSGLGWLDSMPKQRTAHLSLRLSFLMARVRDARSERFPDRPAIAGRLLEKAVGVYAELGRVFDAELLSLAKPCQN